MKSSSERWRCLIWRPCCKIRTGSAAEIFRPFCRNRKKQKPFFRMSGWHRRMRRPDIFIRLPSEQKLHLKRKRGEEIAAEPGLCCRLRLRLGTRGTAFCQFWYHLMPIKLIHFMSWSVALSLLKSLQMRLVEINSLPVSYRYQILLNYGYHSSELCAPSDNSISYYALQLLPLT